MEVGDILARSVHDPGVGFVTLTRVRVTEDLLQARVYYTTLGDEAARKKTARALDRAQPFIRRALGERLRLRRVPEISFTFDQSIAHQARVEELLEQIHRDDEARQRTLADQAGLSAPTGPDDDGETEND
jgi:ribosome-binding factor A